MRVALAAMPALALASLAWFVTGCAGEGGATPPPTLPHTASQAMTGAGYQRLSSFNVAADGLSPATALVDLNGTFYGTTLSGGYASSGPCNGCGTVYSIATAGAQQVIYKFPGAPSGESPNGDLVAADGVLYGTTKHGGKINIPRCPADEKGCGVVYSVAPDGMQTVVHQFGGVDDGAYPEGGLLRVSAALYGTTSGGNHGFGIVYVIGTLGERPIYRFAGPPADGQSPIGKLAELNRKLYGMTAGGGADSKGTIFEVTLKGDREAILHSFSGPDGAKPRGGLTAANGLLYGVAAAEGPHGHGVVFSISSSGSYHIVHAFRGEAHGDGAAPFAAPIFVHGTVLYGTTRGGGTNGHGTVYQIDPHGNETILHDFGPLPDGAHPEAALLWRDGVLYGTTVEGGTAGSGTVFSLTP